MKTSAITAEPPPATMQETQTPPPASRKKIARLAIVAALIVGAFLLWRLLFSGPDISENVIILSGRIEGDDSAVASKLTGRLLQMNVREGDIVKAGDVIGILDDDQVRARENQALAGVAQAEARLRAARQQIAVLNEQVRQSELERGQSKVDAAGRVKQAEAELAAAEAEVAREEASYQLALFDKDAYTRLAQTGAVSERQGKQAQTTANTQAAVVAASKRRLEAARGALTAAQAALSNPDIRSSQIAALQQRIAQQQAEIASAAADEHRANAQLEEARANRSDLTVRAPFEGTVVTRTAEPGEVLAAGTPMITLLDLKKVYLRGYVPEGQIGHVKVGQAARIYLDSNPTKPIEAFVLRIDPQATFTPENTYFRDDRVKQVVGVKLALKEGFGYAKPGMPADGEILIAGDTWPQGSREK